MTELYHSETKFLAMFNPDLQDKYTFQRQRCFSGSAPTLNEVRIGFGRNVATTWLQIQLKNLNEYIGAKEKATDVQLHELAGIILNDYYYLKVTEMMVFLHDVKAGRYGDFYGTFDSVKLMTMMQKFLRVRIDEINIIEQKQNAEKQNAEREQSRKNGVSFDEYLQIKQKAEQGDTEAQELLKIK